MLVVWLSNCKSLIPKIASTETLNSTVLGQNSTRRHLGEYQQKAHKSTERSSNDPIVPTIQEPFRGWLQILLKLPILLEHQTMSFSSLVQDLSFRDTPASAAAEQRRQMARGSSSISTADDQRSHVSRARSYASTSATSVSISGDISSQLHGGYSHPLARAWQAERQLTKVEYLTCSRKYCFVNQAHSLC